MQYLSIVGVVALRLKCIYLVIHGRVVTANNIAKHMKFEHVSYGVVTKTCMSLLK